ncbi:uncharacterized protein N7477_008382 [Penicillium maclennaniae]|uniref:uncharacterized protein n=1 Tax=Penicillium maclennaniae TaxID=1343394 RepID=UPI0025420786|nr:uncharacterized protein N7477_008382 [Penicillium maclennaniae]KAJ5665934.1 hypothetical protein N7477_008382 [Penicillium maclennaniae]
MDPAPQTNISVVDFAEWKRGGSGRRRVAQNIVAACREVGFVYIVNHSLSAPLLDEAFDWSHRFFDLPQDEKLKAPHPEGWAIHRGYSWPGLEKVSQAISQDNDQERAGELREVPDVKESYDIGSEDNSSQPNQWISEESLPGFRAFMNRFYWECFRVGGEILQALAIGLDLDENHLLLKHSGNNNQLRLLHYPSIPAEALERHRAARCPAHTDWSSITLLFQDDCGGLEVEDVNKPGSFIPATPIKNAIVMNVGDLLQRWSNSLWPEPCSSVVCSDSCRSSPFYKPSSHSPPLSNRFEGEQRITRERYSIPYFLAPDPDSVIECIPSCMGVDEPAKYEPITQAGYNKMRASMQY